MSASYTFNVRHDNEIISIPMKNSADLPAFAMRHGGQNWFNKLVSPNDPLASKIRLRYDGAEWALSLDDDGSEAGYDTSAATYGVHKYWLPFTDEVTDDVYWNQCETFPNSTSTYYHKWVAYGSPTIQNGKLVLGSYALRGGSWDLVEEEQIGADHVRLGLQDFTIDCWAQMNTTSLSEAILFYTSASWKNGSSAYELRRQGTQTTQMAFRFAGVEEDANYYFNVPTPITERFHIAYVYHHNRTDDESGILEIYFNGTRVVRFKVTSYARVNTVATKGGFAIGYDNYDRQWRGTIENFRIIDGVALWSENFTPPSTHAEYVAQMNAIPNSAVVPPARIRPTPEPYLKSWLPFDDNTAATSTILKGNYENKFLTFDKCGNYWTGSYGVSITTTNAVSNYALQLDHAYIRTDDFIEFGGADFTVKFTAVMDSDSNPGAVFFAANALTGTGTGYLSYKYSIAFGHKKDTSDFHCIVHNEYGNAIAEAIVPNYSDELHHYELDYFHLVNRLVLYVDGAQVAVLRVNIPRVKRCLFLGRDSEESTLRMMKGSIDEFKLYDGKAMSEYEEPPAPVVENPFRYENAGTAATLTTGGATLNNLPATQSRTGSAFYQTNRAKCFDLPATPEIWLKFDVFFNGSKRWRAYNGGTNGTTGITAQTDSGLSYFANDTNRSPDGANIKGVCIANQLQTVLLHMISGSSDGVVEAWFDGTLIYSYSGDVNHGQDFADIYLQSDGAGTFFSNVIISNEPIALSENATLIPAEDPDSEAASDPYASYLVVDMPFTNSATKDLCDNAWTVTGNPTIENGAIHLPSGAYLTTENIIDLSVESKWTFLCKCKRVTSSDDEGFFGIGDGGSGKRGIVVSSDGIYVDVASGSGWQAKTSMVFPSQSNVWCHLAIVKNGGSLLFFENGQLVWSATITAKPRSNGRLTLGGNSYGYTNDIYLDEVLFYDGVALYTENFTP